MKKLLLLLPMIALMACAKADEADEGYPRFKRLYCEPIIATYDMFTKNNSFQSTTSEISIMYDDQEYLFDLTYSKVDIKPWMVGLDSEDEFRKLLCKSIYEWTLPISSSAYAVGNTGVFPFKDKSYAVAVTLRNIKLEDSVITYRIREYHKRKNK